MKLDRCDICGRDRDTVEIVEMYRVRGVRDICRKCEGKLDKRLAFCRSAMRRWLQKKIRNYVYRLKEQHNDATRTD